MAHYNSILKALKNPLCRDILAVLDYKPMKTNGIHGTLIQKFRSRQNLRVSSVHKALDVLTDVGIISKSYERSKGIIYTKLVKRVIIDLVTNTINLEE